MESHLEPWKEAWVGFNWSYDCFEPLSLLSRIFELCFGRKSFWATSQFRSWPRIAWWQHWDYSSILPSNLMGTTTDLDCCTFFSYLAMISNLNIYIYIHSCILYIYIHDIVVVNTDHRISPAKYQGFITSTIFELRRPSLLKVARVDRSPGPPCGGRAWWKRVSSSYLAGSSCVHLLETMKYLMHMKI